MTNPSGSSGAPSCPPRLQSKHGLQPASSPRTTETNRRRLGNLLASITGTSSSGSSSPGLIRRFRSASINTDSPGMGASASHGSSSRASPSRDRDSDLDLDSDSARDGDGDGTQSASPDLGVGGIPAASGGMEYDPHTPSRSKLWSWFTPTKRAEDVDDDESEEWDEGCFVDAQAYLSDEQDEHDVHNETFISRLPDELLIQIFLHLPPTPTQLHTLSAVSHLWHELSFSPILWSRAFHSSPGFALTPEASTRGVATTVPPPGKWDGLIWDRQAEGSSTSTSTSSRKGKAVEKNSNSAGNHGERGWFGTRKQPMLGRGSTSPTSPISFASPHQSSARASAPTSPISSLTTIQAARSGHTTPIHYPTLYRSRVALPHHIRNPTGSHSAHISTLTQHTDSVYCLQSSGRWMITGSRDRTVRLWRLAEIDEHGAIGETELLCVVNDAHGGSVLSLDFQVEAGDEDGKGIGTMITGSSDTTAGVWRIKWGGDGSGPLSCESHLASGAGGSKQKQGNVDRPSVERIGTLRGHTGGVLDVLMGTRHYVTCSKDATIRIYDRDDYSFLRSIAAHEGPVNCLARNPNREFEQVVSASGDGTWVIWDFETGEAVRNGGGDGRGLACVVWEDDYIVTGDNDRLVKLFSASSTELLRTFEGHTDLVRTVSVNVTDGLLVSGGYDRTIRMWDLHTGQLIRKLATTHTSLVFDIQLTTARLFSASRDNSVQVVTFGTGLPYLGLFA